jgi:hypothetical protein
VKGCAPDYRRAKGFPDKYEAEIAIMCTEAESEARSGTDLSDPNTLLGLAERMESIATAVERLGDISSSYPQAMFIADQLRTVFTA